MSSSESGKGLGGTDPKETFLSARFLPQEEQQVPPLQWVWLGCSPEIAQLIFGRTFDGEMGPGPQQPLWGPAQEEVSEWGSIGNESSLSRDVKSLLKHRSGWELSSLITGLSLLPGCSLGPEDS